MRYLLFLIFFANFILGQDIKKIDSLKAIISKQTDSKTVVTNLIKVSFQYNAINQDSALQYAMRAAEVAKINNYSVLLADAYIEMGKNLANLVGPDTSNYYFELAYRVYGKAKDTTASLTALQNIAINYGRQGKLKISIDYFFKALKLTELIGDSVNIFKVKKNIGLAYFYYGEPHLALRYSYEGYNFFKRKVLLTDLGDCANNIGITFADMDSIKKARRYLDESLDCRKKVGDTIGLITAYLNIGNTFHSLEESSLAEKYYKDGALLARTKKQTSSLVNCLLGLGVLSYESKKPDEAIKYLNEALSLSVKDNYLYEIKFAYNHLYKAYAEKGDYKTAFYYQELHTKMKDSLYSKENDEILLETEAKYQNEKKQLLIDNLSKEKLISEIEVKRQNTIKIGFGIGLVFCVIIAIVLLRGYRLKKRSADELQVKNTIIASQKHEVEEKQKEILDSIGYAKRLQEAILPPQNLWKQCLPQSFILYKPKDIVAGDFFWLEQKGTLVFVAAADCTGHGVPGAMVSVVCSNALNRAVKEFNLVDPGSILDKVRELVIETFEKSENEVKDGMDISLCVFDQKESGKEKVKIKWAGANNPLWYSENGGMVEVTAHKQPIGKTDNAVPFPTITLEVKKGEIVFLFTDGYADQFGGPKGKKFKYKSFLNLLLKNSSESPETQKNELDMAFEEWKGNLEQVDDVTVIGIRV